VINIGSSKLISLNGQSLAEAFTITISNKQVKITVKPSASYYKDLMKKFSAA